MAIRLTEVATRRIQHRYGLVLGLILISLTVQLASPDNDVARLGAATLQGATLVVAVIAARAHPWVVRAAIAASSFLVLAALAAVVGADGPEFGTKTTRVVTLLLVSITPPAIVVGLVRNFRAEGRITLQTMFGVLCVYLLVGMVFANVYSLIELLAEPRFFPGGEHRIADFLYFSFATLTTVGYGDLVANTSMGRSLAITEALVGQIYLVTVVALIVSNLAPRGGARDAKAD